VHVDGTRIPPVDQRCDFEHPRDRGSYRLRVRHMPIAVTPGDVRGSSQESLRRRPTLRSFCPPAMLAIGLPWPTRMRRRRAARNDHIGVAASADSYATILSISECGGVKPGKSSASARSGSRR
jgi:hypothetical protein